MKTKLSLFFLLVAWVAYSSANGQLNQLKFITYTTENGLADNYVVKTISDQKGFLWIATRNGLSRFDGLRFTNFTVDNPTGNGLRSNWITDLALDPKGTAWVSTEWGLCYFDEAAGCFRYLNKKNDVVILYKAPLYANGDELWMATESGLFRISTGAKTMHPTSLKKISDPQSISADADGKIWIGTRGNGLFCYEPATDKWNRVQPAALPATAHYMNFYRDGQNLWACTNLGLLLLPKSGESVLYNLVEKGKPNEVVDELMFTASLPPLTGDSLLICGTYNKRLALFNKRTKRFSGVFSGSDASLFGVPNTIFNNAQSTGNVLWLGTDKGLTMLNTETQDFAAFFLEGLGRDWSQTVVKKVVPFGKESNQLLLLLNKPAGLALYNRNGNAVEKFWPGPAPLRKYNTALTDADGNLWLLHEKGIDCFSSKRGIWPACTVTNQTLFLGRFDAQERLWIGTGDGIMRYDVDASHAEYFSASFNGTAVENTSFPFSFYTKDVCPDDRGRVWMASPKYGLFCFDEKAQRFTPYRQPSSAAYETKNRCNGLSFDAGKLWVSNLDGLASFDTATKSFTNYGRAEGLQSSYSYAIESNGEGILAGRGNAGVYRFQTATKSFSNYTVPIQMSTELLEQQPSFFGNNFYVGFSGGFSVYTVAQEARASDVPVFVTAFTVNNQRRPLTENTSLDYEQNNVQVEYAGVNYNQPSSTVYRYRLNGGPWTEAGTQRTVLLTNLSPGHYQFEVTAWQPGGAQSRQPASLHFVIRPPFWKRWWFYVLCALIVASVLALLYKRRIRLLRRAEALKLSQQKLETEHYRQQLELEQITSFFSGSLVNKTNVTDVLNDVAKNLIGRLGFEDCMIYLWDAERGKLLQKGGYGAKGLIEGMPDQEKYDIEKGRGIVGLTVAHGRPILSNDTANDPRYISADGIISGSELCVPMIYENEIIGAINIEQSQKAFFTKRHLQTVSTIAALAAGKIAALEQTAALHGKELALSQASKRLSETELAMLRSQMNPHFIFNSLNSIQKYIWEAREEDAAEYLSSFAKLMRAILENSRKEFIPLKEELKELKLYVELEHRRSNGRFDYRISVDETIDQETTMVPPLLLQPFIENAIWHGLNKKEQKGDLTISLSREESGLRCVVDDDGVGRNGQASNNGDGKQSLGTEITAERIERIAQSTGQQASVTITDKMYNGKPAGTQVVILLPFVTTESHA